MLVIPGGVSRDLCDGLTRRDLIRVGGSTILGVSLAELLEWQAASAMPVVMAPQAASPQPGWNRARSVILVFLQGGPSHLDLWDPKPDAPENIRSVFQPIATKVAGLQLTELLPRLATVVDRTTLVRSMSYSPAGNLSHTAGIYQMLTGQVANRDAAGGPPGADAPQHIGSHIARLRPVADAAIPFVMTPRGGNSPLEPATFDDLYRDADHAAEQHEIGSYYERALSLVVSGRARSAFDLSREPAEMHDRYGRHSFGQSCLLARRLIEAGTRFVEVNWPAVAGANRHSFDAHVGLSKRMREQAAPMLDSGLSALIADLDERGLLDETLVVAVGEFGRSPRRGFSTSGHGNSDDGRDHWPYCYSALLAGAGIRRGYVYGQSDETASLPIDAPIHPTELVASIYHAVGIRPDTTVRDQQLERRRLVDASPVVDWFG